MTNVIQNACIVYSDVIVVIFLKDKQEAPTKDSPSHPASKESDPNNKSPNQPPSQPTGVSQFLRRITPHSKKTGRSKTSDPSNSNDSKHARDSSEKPHKETKRESSAGDLSPGAGAVPGTGPNASPLSAQPTPSKTAGHKVSHLAMRLFGPKQSTGSKSGVAKVAAVERCSAAQYEKARDAIQSQLQAAPDLSSATVDPDKQNRVEWECIVPPNQKERALALFSGDRLDPGSGSGPGPDSGPNSGPGLSPAPSSTGAEAQAVLAPAGSSTEISPPVPEARAQQSEEQQPAAAPSDSSADAQQPQQPEQQAALSSTSPSGERKAGSRQRNNSSNKVNKYELAYRNAIHELLGADAKSASTRQTPAKTKPALGPTILGTSTTCFFALQSLT